MTAPDNWSNVLEQLRMIQERLREESRKKEQQPTPGDNPQ